MGRTDAATVPATRGADAPVDAVVPRLPAWLRLLRPHHAPITLAAGLTGMAVAPSSPTWGSVTLGVVISACGYPLGQVVNDYFDREADAINAPDRPFVSGAVDPRSALAVVATLAVTLSVAAALVVPGVIVWGVVAIVGHAVYSATKRIPMVGNIANGVDLAVFTLIGAAAVRPDAAWYDLPGHVFTDAVLIAVVLSGFCLVTYFKDIRGDAAVGYRTLPVVVGPRAAAWWVIAFAAVGVVGAAAVAILEPSAMGASGVPAAFWVLMALAMFGFGASVRELFIAPQDRAYEALLWFVRGSILFALALGAAVKPALLVAIGVPLMVLFEVTYLQTRHTRQP
jgi:geranylgeranylglycerol-phosphate geranylgeranyltransferase